MAGKSEEEIKQEKQQQTALYAAIGQFMFEFSQLEFIVRHALGDALNLREVGEEAQFDIVVSPYDFVTLCNVTKAIFVKTMKCSEADQREIEAILNAAVALNGEARVPIAHGTWFIDDGGLGARHVGRTKLEMAIKFSKIGDIDAASHRAATIKSRLVKFLIGSVPQKM